MDTSTETVISSPQVQAQSDIHEDPYAEMTRQNAALSSANTTEVPSFEGSETKTPVVPDGSIPPEELAEQQMMAMRAQIEAAKAEAQAGGENTTGVVGYEAPTDTTNTEPGGVSDKENLERAKAYTEEVRKAFLATPEGQEQIRKAAAAVPATIPNDIVVEKKSIFATIANGVKNIVTAPARAIKKVRDTITSTLSGVKAGAIAFADKISSLLKPTPRQTA